MRVTRRSVLHLPGLLAPLLGAGCAMLAERDGSTWDNVPQMEVLLAPMRIAPQQIQLRRGAPVRLHLVNADTQGRAFYAPGFFANVATRPGEALFGSAGGIELPPGASRSVVLVPLVAGRWTVDSLGDLPAGAAGTITVLAPSG